jgi:outer membrane protein assembly factor BamB
VPPHRIAWSSPVGDPATGRIYIMGGSGVFLCMDINGKVLWRRSLEEEFGLTTTHGGRTVTPVVYGDMVITSGITSSWGTQARGAHRYLAMNKMTGEILWFSQPGGTPYDTCYPTALVGRFGGKELLVDGGADGAIYAMKALTGERVWYYPFSKRAINASVATDGQRIFAAHGQENYDTNTMGRVVALDPARGGDLDRGSEAWRSDGLMVEFPSPVYYKGRLYTIDNGSNLITLDAATGRELWRQTLGTIQKASPVVAGGNIYVGTENGKFYIIEPGDNGCRILDSDQLSEVAGEEEILASVAAAHGRIFLVSTDHIYCIGSKGLPPIPKWKPEPAAPRPAPSAGTATHIRVTPTELLLEPGKEAKFTAESFDAEGQLIRRETAAWSLAGLKGEIDSQGRFTAGPGTQAGEVKAAVGSLTGGARVRVVAPLPWSEDFESYAPKGVPPQWVGAGGKFEVREIEGNKVLVKLATGHSLLRRCRTYMGPWNLSDYTMEADVLGIEARRQQPDIGVIAQRYALVLGGNAQTLTIESWTPETRRSVEMPFPWKGGTWYRVKVRVENQTGRTVVRGKVWPRMEQEPAAWTVTKEDPIPNVEGAPGFYVYAHNEIYFDNIKVTPNSR